MVSCILRLLFGEPSCFAGALGHEELHIVMISARVVVVALQVPRHGQHRAVQTRAVAQDECCHCCLRAAVAK